MNRAPINRARAKPGWAALLAPAALLLVAEPLPLQAQSPGDILPPPPIERRAPARAPLVDALRPTLDGQESNDPSEARLRPAARDGDVSQPAEASRRDGIIDLSAPEPPGPEGIDTSQTDARSQTDANAFQTPPAGGDPQLFQIEDIEPVADRRVGSFFRNEPYAPIGYRIGSFVVLPQLELAGVSFSNVLRNPIARSDVAFEVKPELRLVSNWRWHALELKASGNLNFHEAFPGEDDRAYALEARGRIDLTRRTNLQGLLAQQVTQESRSAIDANKSGPRADVTTTQVAGSLNHRFNRLTLQLRGGVTETSYGAVPDETGAMVASPERNQVQTEQAARVRYDLKSSVGVFAETHLIQRDYGAAAPDGAKRDSGGERYRVGLAFLPNHPRLRGEISVGWGEQRPLDSRLATVDGILLDANLVWRMTPLTSLLFNARSDITESIADGVNGVVVRSMGLEARQLLRRYLTATAGVQVTRNAYSGVDLDEKFTTARLGLEYAISREIQLFSRYEHIWFDSSEVGSGWQADEVRVGMRIRH